jgi:glyoxylase-like metal-dependent hydrolase (beta-lactamase superfamily II)
VVLTVDDVVFAGDLIEESGDPAFGDDCFPLEWPATVRALLGVVGEHPVVVPGHGAPVDGAFVDAQGAALTRVAETIRGLFDAGVPVSDALAHEAWPYPRESLAEAIQRGYAQLR